MSRNGGVNREICGLRESSARRYIDKINKICEKYENDDRTDVQVVDIQNFKTVNEYDDTDEETEPNEYKYFSESDDDYVESSYNDGRCSSSLASSSDRKSPKRDRNLSISPTAVEFKRIEDKFTAKKGRNVEDPFIAKKERNVEDPFIAKKGRNVAQRGNIVKLENTDIFIDILRTAQLQKDQIINNYVESSDDELVAAKEREKGKRRKYDEKNGRVVPNNPITSKKEAGKVKESCRISLEENSDVEPDFGIRFLEEPNYDALKQEGIFNVDKRFDGKRIRNYASSLSSCSFEADSLDSPINRAKTFFSSKARNLEFKLKKI